MGSQVIEITSACNITLHTPWKVGAVVVQVAWRHGKSYLHIDDPAYGTRLHQLLHLEEIRQTAAVIGHEAGYLGLLTHPVDALAVEITACQRLLHIHRLACLHAHDGISGMRRGRCGDIHSIHLRVIYQLLRIGVPALHIVPLGIRPGFLLASAHHGTYAGAWYHGKGRATLLLGDLTAAYKAPLYLLLCIVKGLHKRLYSSLCKFTGICQESQGQHAHFSRKENSERGKSSNFAPNKATTRWRQTQRIISRCAKRARMQGASSWD